MMYYRYDIDGRLVSVSRYDINADSSSILYAQTNTRGDVISLYDGNGDIRTIYTYDSWGKLLSVTDGNGNALGENSVGVLNSIRYRGYVYDSETGLYYLQSRYYDPEVGRFLNADAVDFIGYSGGVLSYNIFAYCENNAIMYADRLGMLALAAVATAIGVTAADIVVATLLIMLIADLATGSRVVLGFSEALGLLVDSVINTISSSFSSSSTKTKTKTLSDTKAKQPQNRPYQLAYIDVNGNLLKVGKKMDLVEALTCLGIKEASSCIEERYTMPNHFKSPDVIKSKKWGIYADSQEDAKTLAVVLNSDAAPKVHGSGYYGHYHDKTHQIHIWYGQPLFY